jgi:hypothetical protein
MICKLHIFNVPPNRKTRRSQSLANAEANAPLKHTFLLEWAPDLPIIQLPHLEASPVPPANGAVNNDGEPEQLARKRK